ncbi:MAG: hypothetical protein AMXMBFR64_22010 [Myxococcales bacterium]
MRVFSYREDRIPVAIFTALFVADLAIFAFVDSLLFVALWAALGLLPKAYISAWNHHHQHVATFRYGLPNRLLELVFALQTGVVGYTWVLHHVLGHHGNYLDQTRDESRWKRKDGTTMGALRYTFEVALTAYPRAIGVGLRHRKVLARFVGMVVLTVAVLAALLWARPAAALLLFVLPMVTSLLAVSWATYSHHAGVDSDNHFEASNNTMHPLYNILTGNLGYHTAHHYRQGVHWSRLPALHAKIADRIPKERYLPPSFPLSWVMTPRAEDVVTAARE